MILQFVFADVKTLQTVRTEFIEVRDQDVNVYEDDPMGTGVAFVRLGEYCLDVLRAKDAWIKIDETGRVIYGAYRN